MGPILVLVPAIIWLYGSGQAGWGTFLLVWTIPVVTLDNVVRPILIKKGADLPLLLIFAGVIGGLVSFGLIGIFVGPVVLAVSHTLLEAWIDSGDAPARRPRTVRQVPPSGSESSPPRISPLGATATQYDRRANTGRPPRRPPCLKIPPSRRAIARFWCC